MKHSKLFLIFVSLVFLNMSCHKDESHGPYEPLDHIPTFSAKINGKIFDPFKTTVGSPTNNNGSAVIISDDTINTFFVAFPLNCGEKTFDLPNTNPNVGLLLNNISCKSGKLQITKYDYNWVEGKFEFELEADSLIKITEGNFSIVYGINKK